MNRPSSVDEPLTLFRALAALATLLPAVLVALPGPLSFLSTDPWPQYAASAWVLIGSMPMLLFLISRDSQRSARGRMLVVLPLLIAVLWMGFGELSDQLEASRALFVLLSACASFLSAASLVPAAQRIYARGLVVISILLCLGAWSDPGGVLGNSGSLSHMALAGAVVGLCFCFDGGRGERVLGLCALGLFLLHSSQTPVLAGAAALGIASLAALARGSGRTRLWSAAAAALAIAALAWPMLGTARSEPSAAAPIAAVNHSGGLAVRASVWQQSCQLFLDHSWRGVGPGQFAATFPPYRAVEEIESSSLQRRMEAETEVDHPHNDTLALLIEGGLVSGLCWLLLAGWVLLRFWQGGPHIHPLGLAAIALLANSCVHGVLSYDAGSAVIGYACMGALLSEQASARGSLGRRLSAILLLGVLALQLPRAQALIAHGAALRVLGGEISSISVERAVERALAACPDSVHARALQARTQSTESAWLAVLEQRPERVEAWIQLGVVRARAMQLKGARAAFEHALRLDAWHPALLENYLTLISRVGSVQETQAALAALRARKPPSSAWLENRAESAWLWGNEAVALALQAESGQAPWPTVPGEAYALARERRQKGALHSADTLESIAQRGFARRHASEGRYAEAVRNYRQDLSLSHEAIPGGAPRVRWELSAALAAQHKFEEAEQARLGLEPIPDLPEWALRALESKP